MCADAELAARSAKRAKRSIVYRRKLEDGKGPALKRKNRQANQRLEKKKKKKKKKRNSPGTRIWTEDKGRDDRARGKWPE
jgi:hypothetical protein